MYKVLCMKALMLLGAIGFNTFADNQSFDRSFGCLKKKIPFLTKLKQKIAKPNENQSLCDLDWSREQMQWLIREGEGGRKVVRCLKQRSLLEALKDKNVGTLESTAGDQNWYKCLLITLSLSFYPPLVKLGLHFEELIQAISSETLWSTCQSTGENQECGKTVSSNILSDHSWILYLYLYCLMVGWGSL